MNKYNLGIEGIKVYAHHGHYEIEQKIGQEFTLDVYVNINESPAGTSDFINDTIDYEKILNACKEEMAIPSKLLEHVAERIGNRIKNLSVYTVKVKVRISKQHPMVPLQIDRFFVEVKI